MLFLILIVFNLIFWSSIPPSSCDVSISCKYNFMHTQYVYRDNNMTYTLCCIPSDMFAQYIDQCFCYLAKWKVQGRESTYILSFSFWFEFLSYVFYSFQLHLSTDRWISFDSRRAKRAKLFVRASRKTNRRRRKKRINNTKICFFLLVCNTANCPAVIGRSVRASFRIQISC